MSLYLLACSDVKRLCETPMCGTVFRTATTAEFIYYENLSRATDSVKDAVRFGYSVSWCLCDVGCDPHTEDVVTKRRDGRAVMHIPSRQMGCDPHTLEAELVKAANLRVATPAFQPILRGNSVE